MTSQLTSPLEVSRGSKAVYERMSEMKVVNKLRDVGILISLTDRWFSSPVLQAVVQNANATTVEAKKKKILICTTDSRCEGPTRSHESTSDSK